MSETIVRLAARGDGVTESGRFVALTALGDTIGKDGSIVRGPHHTDPPCPHFPQCGGCQLQHVGDDAYAEFVRDRIVGALAAQGLDAPVFKPVHLSPAGARRRASLRAMRIGKRIVLGFNEAGSSRIVDVRACPVLHPGLTAILEPMRDLLATLIGDRRAAPVTMTLADQGIDLAIGGVSVEGLAATEALTRFAARHRLARLSIDEGYGAEARWEPAPVTVTLGGVPVALPEGAFLQATADGEAALRDAVAEALAGATRLADLFAGLGTFALALDRPVLAAEGARDAILALQAAAARAQRPVQAEHRDLFRRPLTAKELNAFDGVALDPPRAGAKEQVAEIAASGIPRIAYVSCNPATFARDARTLIDGGYRLDWIRPVGQFRWSTHVELAAAFSR
jgi:23S rRNA (uracil1939-C5)-methyltransferase